MSGSIGNSAVFLTDTPKQVGREGTGRDGMYWKTGIFRQMKFNFRTLLILSLLPYQTNTAFAA